MLYGKSGSAVVEIAITLPIVIFLIIGIMYMGLYINSRIVVNHAARVGAREYGITGSKSEAEDRVSEELSKGVLAGTFDVECERSGDRVCVDVSYKPNVSVPPMLLSLLSSEDDFFKVKGFADYRRDKP